MKFNKTRIAPTPSGFLHLGNLYSFALTAALAEKTGAKVLLRIDDMDAERVEDRYLDDIFDTLHYMGIAWQEGPRNTNELKQKYSQKNRLPLYEAVLAKLAESGKVFACSCSRKDLEQYGGRYPGTCRHKGLNLQSSDLSWRLDTSEDISIQMRRADGKVSTEKLPASMHYTILRRRDGLPAYQVCSLIDDVHFGVDLVVRGQDLYDSSLFQLYLAKVLEESIFLKTVFVHHALIKNQAGNKLSKTAGSESLKSILKTMSGVESVYEHLAELAGIKRDVKSWRDIIDQSIDQNL
ncbi:MAG TPA: glutamate--tRNA ligase family protein [Bacteroidia bacterium]|nr:glutamate--tRNA ligase family protein [Bacteroidia bacterium]